MTIIPLIALGALLAFSSKRSKATKYITVYDGENLADIELEIGEVFSIRFKSQDIKLLSKTNLLKTIDHKYGTEHKYFTFMAKYTGEGVLQFETPEGAENVRLKVG